MPWQADAVALSDVLALKLAAHRTLTVEGEPDEALTYWHAELVINRDSFEDPEDPEEREWAGIPDGVAVADGQDLVVAQARLFAVDLFGSNPIEALDAAGADEVSFAELVIAAHDGGDDLPTGPGSRLLVLDRVSVPELWRGRRLGPVVAAAALRELATPVHIVACYPSPFELERDDPGWPGEKARLERLWTAFGFEAFRGGVWVLPEEIVADLDEVFEIQMEAVS